MSSDQPDIGLTPAVPITADEKAELNFLRYEAAYMQQRLDAVEDELEQTIIERDTIRHERNLMAQDFSWTLRRLARSPAGPILSRTEGFTRMLETWGHAAD